MLIIIIRLLFRKVLGLPKHSGSHLRNDPNVDNLMSEEMNMLSTIENKYHILLPECYKSFYGLCTNSIPAKLVGTDIWNNKRFDLNEGAIELLEEVGINNFLESDDFVFMMHQGYIFWYFKANGNPDPIVYCYFENKLAPDSCGRFSDFIKEFTE